MKCIVELQDYFNELEKAFHYYFIEILSRCEEEDVHQLRVNMKRQVAFFHLLEFLDPSFSPSRALNAYGKLYKKAGKVRNYQVEKKVIRQEEGALQLAQHFSNWLAEQERLHRLHLQAYERDISLVPIRRLAYLVRNRIQYLPEGKLPQYLQSYFSHLFSLLKEWADHKKPLEESFHNLRKHIKELFFNLSLIHQLLPVGRLPQQVLKTLDDFQKVLGNWHDCYFTLKKISHGQELCPPEIVIQLERERKQSITLIKRKLKKLPTMITRLEQMLFQVFETEPMERGRQPVEQVKRNGSMRSSFVQVNRQERSK